MTRFFPPPTAEQVLTASDAVSCVGKLASVDFVAEFADIPTDRAESALLVSADLGLVVSDGPMTFAVASPICRFLGNKRQNQRSAVLRLLLESYEPFVVFRDRLGFEVSPDDAARQTKAILNLPEHYTDVLSTLISLGTFSQALTALGGGQYEMSGLSGVDLFGMFVRGSDDLAGAEFYVSRRLGEEVINAIDRIEVVTPLVNAVVRARSGDSRGAVVSAGNALESYLAGLAAALQVQLTGTGINQKLDSLRGSAAQVMAKKIQNIGYYLGHVRNAADHGIDTDVKASWTISETMGLEYVSVTCTFIVAAERMRRGESPAV